MVEDVAVIVENSVGEPVITHVLPEIFGWVEFGAFCGQMEQGDSIGNVHGLGALPTGLIKQQHRVSPRGNVLRDFKPMLIHCCGGLPTYCSGAQ
jgi:hypothetical protein